MASDEQPLHQPDSLPRAAGGGKAAEPPPRSKSCAGYTVYKMLSIVYAILFFFIGLLLSGIAVWIIVIKQEVQSLNHVVLSPVILLLVVGVIIIATALIGCLGASCDKLWPLRIYLGIVILVFILQVIVGILAYVYREEAIQNVGGRLLFGVKRYNESADIRKAVDKIQRDGKCCGIEKPDDWNNNVFYSCSNRASKLSCGVPDSCCISEELILGIFVVYMFITKVEDRIRLFKYRKRYYDN